MKWMKVCVGKVYFLIMVNGSPVVYFKSLRCLRHWEPLSLILFIMVMEDMSRMINRAESGFLTSFELEIGNLRISHLQFADDIIIFCNASVRQLGFLWCIGFELETGNWKPLDIPFTIYRCYGHFLWCIGYTIWFSVMYFEMFWALLSLKVNLGEIFGMGNLWS